MANVVLFVWFFVKLFLCGFFSSLFSRAWLGLDIWKIAAQWLCFFCITLTTHIQPICRLPSLLSWTKMQKLDAIRKIEMNIIVITIISRSVCSMLCFKYTIAKLFKVFHTCERIIKLFFRFSHFLSIASQHIQQNETNFRIFA